MGLEIYSLRREAAKDLPATLALIRKFGFKEVEGGDFYGHSAAEFRKMLDGNGLKLTSMMAAYDRLSRDINSVADDAHTLGAEYLVCSTVPHKQKLTAEDCERAIESLNRFGENLAKDGLQNAVRADFQHRIDQLLRAEVTARRNIKVSLRSARVLRQV